MSFIFCSFACMLTCCFDDEYRVYLRMLGYTIPYDYLKPAVCYPHQLYFAVFAFFRFCYPLLFYPLYPAICFFVISIFLYSFCRFL